MIMAQATHATLPKSLKFSRNSAENGRKHPPRIAVRYFYKSLSNIDDTLSPIPTSTATLSHGASYLRPYSDYDNTVLDQTWISLYQRTSKFGGRPWQRTSAQREEYLQAPAHDDALRPHEGSQSHVVQQNLSARGRDRSEFSYEALNNLYDDACNKGPLTAEHLEDDVQLERSSTSSKLLDKSTFKLDYKDGDANNGETGLARKPFVRVPSEPNDNALEEYKASRADSEDQNSPETIPAEAHSPGTAVPVGIERLHQVLMPQLRMDPIYWSTVHDSYAVLRGTWFYKSTMLPVESDIANLLEMGYLELRPWTDTWIDELNSAAEVGALGEEKISHALWPDSRDPKWSFTQKPDSLRSSVAADERLDSARRCSHVLDRAKNFIDRVSESNIDNKAAGVETYKKNKATRLYLNACVIYANEKEATILRPSLAPSAYYGRRPYASYIRKGFKIGIPVVRGFDSAAFDKLNPNGLASKSTPANKGNAREHGTSDVQVGQVTDLVLVIHGIGQKLSERVESFHFTHAMNTFRRGINAELHDPAVQSHKRNGMGKIMVLPVNWRSTLSFEGNEYPNSAQPDFSLKDITPNGLSSIRNIISDVMLDIPYYLSHHQPKIISAVVKEANRIYKLWCKNNPGFLETGRVHLIAHSLGSVIAMDILSKQPTMVNLDHFQRSPDVTNFIFNTTNIFFCGSPAGFFLLLRKARLVPRRGRKGGSVADEDSTSTVYGSRYTYGCLAVDNIYNIINPYDPVAYHLNATIDANYAASLKPAYVPRSSVSWFSWGSNIGGKSGISSSKRSKAPGSERLPCNVELEIHNFSQEEVAEQRAYLLNDNGQIDFLLHYGGGPLDIQYLTMLSAHSSYWISKDFVRFVVLETSRSPSPDGALDEMKAIKRKAFVV